MKNLIVLSLVLLLTLSILAPGVTAQEFVPSIGYKDSPEIIEDEDGIIGIIRDENGEIIDYVPAECLWITHISNVYTCPTIPEHSRQTLIYVYTELSEGRMELPAEKLSPDLEPDELVIRELFDASWLCEDHPEILEPKGVTIEISFRVNIPADQTLYVMSYKHGEWNPIVFQRNNGDNTVTCIFEDFCPVAFIVGEDQDAPATGHELDRSTVVWLLMFGASSVALIAMVANRRKASRR